MAGKRVDARIYGELKNLSDESRQALSRDMPLFERAEFESGVLTIEHEAWAVDDVFEFMTRAAGLGATGHLDHIDNEAWTITRYVIDEHGLKTRRVGLNEVLEGLRTS